MNRLDETARRAVATLTADLRSIFESRLRSIVAYGPGAGTEPAVAGPAVHPLNTLALVERVTFSDLNACAVRSVRWKRLNLAVPLILACDEFVRSLDVFPMEYGAILERHVVVAGDDPFEGMAVSPYDLRRACELQAQSQLIHLREGYVEVEGEPTRVADLLSAAASAFASLARNVVRLDGVEPGPPAHLAHTMARLLDVSPAPLRQILDLADAPTPSGAEALALFPACLDASERLCRYVDRWRHAGTGTEEAGRRA